MNQEKNVSQEKDSGQRQVSMAKPVAILFSGLFLIALVGLVYLLTSNNVLNRNHSKMKTQVEDLDTKKENLESELLTIEQSFTEKISENEDLSATLEERVEEVEVLESRLNDARSRLSTSEKENAEIKTRLTMLEEVKNDLQTDIDALAVTNTELRKANEEINLELEKTQEYAMELNEHLVEMSETNSKLLNRLYTIAPAGYVADNFVVISHKRNEKLTTKARRTDAVRVRFDLSNVPEDYHGEESIYLVLTEFDGKPVSYIPSRKVRIDAAEPFDIKAADMEKLKINESQNLEMSVKTDRDLDAGTYNLLVYADHGFLGATAFELR